MEYKPNTYGAIVRRDLDDAIFVKDSRPHMAVFSAQQAIEKILKHYITLYYKGPDRSDLLKSHKLYFLSHKSGLTELKKYRGFLNTLSQFYFDGMYPGIDFETPTQEDADELIPITIEVFKIIESKICCSKPLKRMSLFDED